MSTSVDIDNLPIEVREKLAELDLELSEGMYQTYKQLNDYAIRFLSWFSLLMPHLFPSHLAAMKGKHESFCINFHNLFWLFLFFMLFLSFPSVSLI